ncbi:hypothetical protein Pyn_22856 [Prunus yedoensis var. nudiflora]|uniref:Uncharacterized protein n=1 Tax=Prunus yedoensis var. nudiflora TaxID=2094558 RepID=A0A314YBJ9_PRUYE|nr:hypothetical protein Pyn_22856 [Prunus yedoensis var. nudiflora]
MAQSSKEHPKEAQRLSDLNRSKHIHSTGAFHVESTHTTIHDRFSTRDKIEQRLRNEEITVLAAIFMTTNMNAFTLEESSI